MLPLHTSASCGHWRYWPDLEMQLHFYGISVATKSETKAAIKGRIQTVLIITAHRSLSRVNLFTVLRLSSLFHALILFFDYRATLLVFLICLWPFVAGTPTAGFQEVSMQRMSSWPCL